MQKATKNELIRMPDAEYDIVHATSFPDSTEVAIYVKKLKFDRVASRQMSWSRHIPGLTGPRAV